MIIEVAERLLQDQVVVFHTEEISSIKVMDRLEIPFIGMNSMLCNLAIEGKVDSNTLRKQNINLLSNDLETDFIIEMSQKGFDNRILLIDQVVIKITSKMKACLDDGVFLKELIFVEGKLPIWLFCYPKEDEDNFKEDVKLFNVIFLAIIARNEQLKVKKGDIYTVYTNDLGDLKKEEISSTQLEISKKLSTYKKL